MSSRSSSTSSKPASIAKSSSSSGSSLVLDLLDGDLERRVPAGELLGAVVRGERQLDRARLAGARRRAAPPRSRGSGCRRRARRAGRGPRRPRTARPGGRLVRAGVLRAAGSRRSRRRRSRPARPRARPSPAAPGARASPRSPARPARPRPSGSRRATSRPLYSPSSAFGSTPISIENSSAWPCGGRSPRSTFGSPTGTMPAVSIASEYQLESVSRTASSSTASRPTRCSTSGAGTLPLRKPGSFSSRPSWRAALLDATLDLARRHLHLQAHARLGQLGDGGLQGGGHARHDTVPLRDGPAHAPASAAASAWRPGCGPARPVTSSGGALDFAAGARALPDSRERVATRRDSLGAQRRPAVPNDSATPRGTTSTGQVAISIRCAAEELIETRPGVGVRARVDHQQVASARRRPARPPRRAPPASAWAVACALPSPPASPTATIRCTPASRHRLGQSGRSDRDRDRTALEQPLGGVADRDVALGGVGVRAEHDHLGADLLGQRAQALRGRAVGHDVARGERAAEQRGAAVEQLPGPPASLDGLVWCGARRRGTPRRRRGRSSGRARSRRPRWRSRRRKR